MNAILVPTDFSACADKALAFATVIARQANAKIVLLHVTDEILKGEPEGLRPSAEAISQSLTQTVQARLHHLAQQTSLQTGLPVTEMVVDGNLTQAIQKAISQNNIHLIVMGTEGATGFRKKMMGSNTAATIGQVNIPVLTVPAHYSGNSISKILLALKNGEDDLHLLAPAFELGTLFGAKLQLAIFTGTKDNAATYIDDRRTMAGIQYRLHDLHGQQLEAEHLSGNDFQETLQQYILSNHIDLLVMITHKRNAIESLFQRSFTRQMAYHTSIPLLSLQK